MLASSLAQKARGLFGPLAETEPSLSSPGLHAKTRLLVGGRNWRLSPFSPESGWAELLGGEVELSLVAQSRDVEVEIPRWSLAPSVPRVAAIDESLRLRLAQSLAYLAEVASLAETHAEALAEIERRLGSGPVSPWVFCLYSKLVAELAKTPQGDCSATFAAVIEAASLPGEDAGVVCFGDRTASAVWWDQFRLLFDTDRQRPFEPKAPSPENFAACQETIAAGLALFERADPVFHEEVRHLVRMIVLGAPGSDDPADGFNGASTFFLWGASLLNADPKRSTTAMVDLLVHESSHVLLFGVSAEGALTENSGASATTRRSAGTSGRSTASFTPVLSRRACISP